MLFGDSVYQVKEFILKLLDGLLEAQLITNLVYQDAIASHENLDMVLRMLYCHCGEYKVKSFICENFKSRFHEVIYDSYSLCTPDLWQFLQKYKCVPLTRNTNELIVIVDIISCEMDEWLRKAFNVSYVRYEFATKNCIIAFLSKIYSSKLINTTREVKGASNLNVKKFSIFFCIFLFCFFFFSCYAKTFAICTILFFNILYIISAGYKLFFALNGKTQRVERNSNLTELPIYSILLPVFKEPKAILAQVIDAIKKIDYPIYNLEIFFLVEEIDQDTLSIINSLNLNYAFATLIIPEENLKTKAKACNYAISFCSGEFLVIYDADDIPDIQQLKKSIIAFRQDQNLTCVQSLLNCYNKTNFLTQYYSTEFSIWFKVFLPGFLKANLPITLGGTSNHFRLKVLKQELWDSYNVTEDADLGIRFWLKGHKVTIIESETLEEAPISIKAWINQRSRWIKGFLQTYFVHKNSSASFLFSLWLNLFIFLPIFCQATAIPMIFEFLAIKFIFKDTEILKTLNTITLYFLIVSYALQCIPALFIKRSFKIVFLPLYFSLNIFATHKAIFQFFTKQYFWEKTEHGIFKRK